MLLTFLIKVSHCRIDDNGYRYLLGDSEGSLYVLILFGEGDNSENGGGGSGGGGRVDSLKLEYLGQVIPVYYQIFK